MGDERKSIQPDYGRRLLVHVIDERARDGHPRPWASIPVDRYSVEGGYRDISYSLLSSAINRCAHWLKATISRSVEYEPVAYIGPHDIRYHIVMLAASKSGHVMFFPSPRNSLQAFLHLLEAGNIRHMIAPEGNLPVVATVTKERAPVMQTYSFPSLDYFLSDDEPVDKMEFNKTWAEARQDPFVLLHTSGSTGMPKLVPLKHGYSTVPDGFLSIPLYEAFHRMGQHRTLVPFPPSHMAGVTLTTMCTVFNDYTVIFPPIAPLTADLVDRVHIAANADFSMLPPALITDLANEPRYLSNLGRLKGLNFAGGPLSQATGDAVREYTTLYNSIGSTEYGLIPFRKKERPEDWSWLSFEEEHCGLDMQKQEGGDLYEMVLVRDKRYDLIQAIFVTFPELDRYHTKDLFIKHPTRPHLWRYHGRLDDVIVLTNGEKLVPVSMEGVICTCPKLKGCLIFGQGRFQPGLLIEPRLPVSTADQRASLLESLWPYVEKANQDIGRHGVIVKEMIIFVDADRPLPRAGKGTIQRAAANTLYAPDIDALYLDVERGRTSKAVPSSIDASSQQRLQETVLAFIHDDLDLPFIKVHDDFFTSGMDSLMTITLVREINAALHGLIEVQSRNVYDNASVQELATYLWHCCTKGNNDEDVEDGYDSDVDFETWNKMQGLYDEMRKDLPVGGKRQSWRTSFWSSDNHRIVMPPDGGAMAWLQVFGCFLVQFNNWGIVNSWGLFQEYYEQMLLQSTRAESIAWIGTLQGALLLIVGVISGPLFDMGLFQPILIIVAVLLSFAFMMVSLATEYYQLLLAQGILVGVCIGMLYIPSIALINLYFTSKRGLALGLATSGGAIGGIIYPIMFRRVLEMAGFAWATRAIGFLVLGTLLAAAIILKPAGPMKQPTRRLIDWSAFKEMPFVCYMMAALLIYLGILVPFFLASTFATQRLGLDQSFAFYCIAILNAGQVFGRVLPSILSDWIGPESLLLGSLTLAIALSFSWVAVSNLGGFIVFLVLYGFASGAVSTLSAAVMPYICPNLATVGTRFGMVYSVAGLGILASNPVATKLIYQDHRSYLGTQLWTGLAILLGSLFYAFGTFYEARRRRLQSEAWGKKKQYIFRKGRNQKARKAPPQSQLQVHRDSVKTLVDSPA